MQQPPGSMMMQQPPAAMSNLEYMQKFASQGSVTSLASRGYMPPGHGYVPRRQKPEKPYGLSFRTRMNRTHRGPGEKYLRYAAVCGGFALLFFLGAALYFGHRNVSRMIVLRTEVLGVLLIVAGLCLVYMMGRFIFRARVESNRWRYYIRFRPEGLNTAAATNTEFFPETKATSTLQSGTYGKKALREIPKPKFMKKKKKDKMGSKASLLATPEETQEQLIQSRGQPYPPQGLGYAPQVHGYPPSSGPPSMQGPPEHTSSPAATLQPMYKAPQLQLQPVLAKASLPQYPTDVPRYAEPRYGEMRYGESRYAVASQGYVTQPTYNIQGGHTEESDL